MEEFIYLDYNATTPIDQEVAKEMMPFINDLFGNPSSPYPIGIMSNEAVNKARKQVADLINASSDEIIFTSGGTESNNHAIRGVAFANRERGKHIITSAVEHPAVTEVCSHLQTLGFEITCLPVDVFGRIDPKEVENAVRPDTVLITMMHANNEVGTIQPIREIADIARRNNIYFHTDAAQSVGKIETDVRKLGVDLLTIAGHKLYAPKGIGALYIKRGTKIENLMYGAKQEMGFRPGTENVIQIVGLGKACEIAQQNFDRNVNTMLATKNNLLNGLKNRFGERVKVNGKLSEVLPNTLSVAIDGIEAHTLASMVSDKVFISTGSACHANSVEISSVLKAMNIDKMTAASTVRLSTGRYTTENEIERAVEIISEAVNELS